MVFKVTVKSKGSTNTHPSPLSASSVQQPPARGEGGSKNVLGYSYHRLHVVEFNPWRLGKTFS